MRIKYFIYSKILKEIVLKNVCYAIDQKVFLKTVRPMEVCLRIK